MLQAIVIFVGLSLDSFIVMMQKGAQLTNFPISKKALYALVYALTNCGMFLLGYAISMSFKGIIPDDRLEIAIACLIIVTCGVWLMTKSYKNKTFVEKVDHDFSMKKLLRLAVYTSIDTLSIGAGFSLLGIHFISAVLISFITSYITIFFAMEIGYNLGASYQRAVGMFGGALMIIFSMYLMAVHVLKFVM